MQGRTITKTLNRLVENQIAKYGCQSLLDFQRQYPNKDLFDEPLCPFINRLCPEDLCYLPADHVGTEEGYHITGTTAYDDAHRWHYKSDLGVVGASRRELISLGSRLQELDEVEQ
jgi:hypothetical protein